VVIHHWQRLNVFPNWQRQWKRCTFLIWANLHIWYQRINVISLGVC
jgi:hypothetical protein